MAHRRQHNMRTSIHTLVRVQPSFLQQWRARGLLENYCTSTSNSPPTLLLYPLRANRYLLQFSTTRPFFPINSRAAHLFSLCCRGLIVTPQVLPLEAKHDASMTKKQRELVQGSIGVSVVPATDRALSRLQDSIDVKKVFLEVHIYNSLMFLQYLG